MADGEKAAPLVVHRVGVRASGFYLVGSSQSAKEKSSECLLLKQALACYPAFVGLPLLAFRGTYVSQVPVPGTNIAPPAGWSPL